MMTMTIDALNTSVYIYATLVYDTVHESALERTLVCVF